MPSVKDTNSGAYANEAENEANAGVEEVKNSWGNIKWDVLVELSCSLVDLP